MKRGWWKLDCTIEPDDATLEHIAGMIREGYTSGEMIVEEDDDNDFFHYVTDNELCINCLHLMYDPDDLSVCKKMSKMGKWPAIFNERGDSVSCVKFKDKGETK